MDGKQAGAGTEYVGHGSISLQTGGSGRMNGAHLLWPRKGSSARIASSRQTVRSYLQRDTATLFSSGRSRLHRPASCIQRCCCHHIGEGVRDGNCRPRVRPLYPIGQSACFLCSRSESREGYTMSDSRPLRESAYGCPWGAIAWQPAPLTRAPTKGRSHHTSGAQAVGRVVPRTAVKKESSGALQSRREAISCAQSECCYKSCALRASRWRHLAVSARTGVEAEASASVIPA